MKALFEVGHQIHICPNQLPICLEFDIFALVFDADESIESAALEGTGNPLANDIFKVLEFAWNLDVDVDVPVVHALDLDEHTEPACLGPTGALELYRTYAYDDEGRLAELRFYNYNKDAGEEIEA